MVQRRYYGCSAWHHLRHLPHSAAFCRVSSLSRIAFLDPNLLLQRQHQVLYNIQQEDELARPGLGTDSSLEGGKTTSLKPPSPVSTAGYTNRHLSGTVYDGGVPRTQQRKMRCEEEKRLTGRGVVGGALQEDSEGQRSLKWRRADTQRCWEQNSKQPGHHRFPVHTPLALEYPNTKFSPTRKSPSGASSVSMQPHRHLVEWWNFFFFFYNHLEPFRINSVLKRFPDNKSRWQNVLPINTSA